jgi:hypothetical protein
MSLPVRAMSSWKFARSSLLVHRKSTRSRGDSEVDGVNSSTAGLRHWRAPVLECGCTTIIGVELKQGPKLCGINEGPILKVV